MFYLKVVRCICIMDHPVPNLPVKDQTSCQIIIPQSAVDRKSGTVLNFSCSIKIKLLRAALVTRNPSLQAVISHALHVCSQHSFGLPLRMNGMHKTQFDHAHFDLLPRVIWSRVFWPSVKWNIPKSKVLEQKCLTAFGPPIIVTALHNLWLWLVLIKNCCKLPLISFGPIQHCKEFFSLRRQM